MYKLSFKEFKSVLINFQSVCIMELIQQKIGQSQLESTKLSSNIISKGVKDTALNVEDKNNPLLRVDSYQMLYEDYLQHFDEKKI